MSTFEDTRKQFIQEHFTVVEIDLPTVEGVCTVNGEPGFGTPLTCDQPSNATMTYKFRDINSPVIFPESGVFRMIDSISETPTKIMPEKGLAARGSAKVRLVDQLGIDPNRSAPAVTEEVINSGGYLAKLNARNILVNRECRIKNYRVESDGTIDLVNGAETKYYLIESFDYIGQGKWSISLKDELSRVNIDEAVWPLSTNGYLRSDINDSQTNIPVDQETTYAIGDVIRVGDEFFFANSVSGIGTPLANISIPFRGFTINGVNGILTKTAVEEHSQNDEVFLCEVSNDEKIYDLIERILLDVGVDASYIPKADWVAEIDEWLPTATVNTIWYESEDVNDVIESILSSFMINMWFDPIDRKIKMSAVNVWKESSASVFEGNEIDKFTVKRELREDLRSTRALVVYDKRFLATSDSVENYNRAALFTRTELETDDFYGEPKTKRFGLNKIISEDSAELLVNRYVNRYSNPYEYMWTTQENKLSFIVGDVLNVYFDDFVGPDGKPVNSGRAQVTSIKPKYTKNGRVYSVSALSYEPIFDTGSEIVISGNVTEINLFTQYAGAPSQPVELTFVFDGATVGSLSSSTAAIRAGAFPSGSKLIIILANGADLKAIGGNGGTGATMTYFQGAGWSQTTDPTNGADGGTVFDAQGVDCDIYFSGATPSSNYPVADGKIFAPSGGDGGFDCFITTDNDSVAGDGGNGGNGRVPGLGGFGGTAEDAPFGEGGKVGTFGVEDGTIDTFGKAGKNNNATGGIAGSGVVDNGGTVNFFGDDATRYVNGLGDH